MALVMWGVGAVFGPVLGPILGSIATEAYDWHAAFFMIVPPGICALVCIWFALRDHTGRTAVKFDWLGFIALSVCGAAGQSSVFTDQSVEYTFTLPEDKWTMVVRPSATNPNVEYVYGDRRDGYLTIRKLTVGKDAVMSDVIQDEAQSVQFRPGYVANKDETFTGKLKGTVFNFEYVAASRPMAGRYYFLRADPTRPSTRRVRKAVLH
jgi:hypothetical protein